MTAADTNLSSEHAQQRLVQFTRAVFARLAMGALAAWAGACAAVVISPVRDGLFVMDGDAVAGIDIAGYVAVIAPFLLWVAARVYVRRPTNGAGAFFWLFALSAGVGLNTAFFGLTGNSIASVFLVSLSCFVALNLLTRLSRRRAGSIGTVIAVISVGGGLALLIDRVLMQGAYLAVDVAAASSVAVLVLAAAPGLVRLWTQQELATRWNELVDYGAMSVVTLTKAPAAAQITQVDHGGTSSAARWPAQNDVKRQHFHFGEQDLIPHL